MLRTFEICPTGQQSQRFGSAYHDNIEYSTVTIWLACVRKTELLSPSEDSADSHDSEEASSMTESRNWVTMADSTRNHLKVISMESFRIRITYKEGCPSQAVFFFRSIFLISISLRLEICIGGSHLPKRFLLLIYVHISTYAGLRLPSVYEFSKRGSPRGVLPLTPTKTLFPKRLRRTCIYIPSCLSGNPINAPTLSVTPLPMSSRLDSMSASASSSLATHTTPLASTHSHPHSRLEPAKAWVDPASLPDYGVDPSSISGNVPDYVKQLNSNTYFSYGVGDEDCFGHQVGKTVKFVEVNVDRRIERQDRLESTTVAEVLVTKHMLNGAGMLHGGCVAYLIDNCCSSPLVVLGLIQNVNGVGVTQAMNVLFHSPASLGTRVRIISTSVALGGRVMTSRCEIIDKDTGRIIASAFLNKMQPAMSRL